MLIFKLMVGGLISWLVGSWSLMLSVGVAHSVWWPTIPLLGFTAALSIIAVPVLMAVIAGLLLGLFGIVTD